MDYSPDPYALGRNTKLNNLNGTLISNSNSVY